MRHVREGLAELPTATQAYTTPASYYAYEATHEEWERGLGVARQHRGN